MEKSPSGAPSSALVKKTSPTQHRNNMTTLAIPPLPLPAFPRDHHWDSIRSAPPLSRLDSNNALPSIRELLPAHLLTSQLQDGPPSSRGASLTSPAPLTPALQTSPGYVHTTQGQKRRRLSLEDDQETERTRQVPRLYQPAEPKGYPRRESPTIAHRTDGYYSEPQRPASSDKYPTPREVNGSADTRPAVPSLLPPKGPVERGSRSPYRSDVPVDSYATRATQPAHVRTPSLEQHPGSYRGSSSSDYGYSNFQPSNRFASAPSSANPYERTPFSTPPYASQYQDYGRFAGDLGHGGIGGETKQRKRRGNLPKETTDKLRAWFVGHLQHPYPTEDEKQELMRQTGLQMNQISNWFINARRRQLPNMINDARAESDAMSGRSLQSPADASNYDRPSRDHLNHSDGEGRQYDEDMRLRRGHRESI